MGTPKIKKKRGGEVGWDFVHFGTKGQLGHYAQLHNI